MADPGDGGVPEPAGAARDDETAWTGADEARALQGSRGPRGPAARLPPRPPRVGDAVRERFAGLVNDVGTVDRVYVKTWGRARGEVHSVRTTHVVRLRAADLRLVLHWAGGRWRNRLHREAEYTVGEA